MSTPAWAGLGHPAWGPLRDASAFALRASERWRGRPVWVRDGALAATVAAVELVTLTVADPASLGWVGFAGPDATSVGVVLAMNAPLALRRVVPHAVVGVTLLLAVAAVCLRVPSQLFAPLVALYTVGAYRTRAGSLAWLALMLPVAAVLVARFGELGSFPSQALVIGTAWLLGDRHRLRMAYAAELEARAAELEGDRERAAAIAVAEERGRVARELHDVLAHSLSVMVVTAAAARCTLQRDPERARNAVVQAVATGRESLGQLRRLLGLLDAPSAPLVPQPGLADIDELVAGFERAGVAVCLEVEGQPRPLPGSVEVSAYRIVQESLTNVLKHAGRGPAMVRLEFRDGALHVQVVDDGGGPAPAGTGEARGGTGQAPGGTGQGHGLVGMRERAALVGGTLTTGPRPGGGFAVQATLPWEEIA